MKRYNIFNLFSPNTLSCTLSMSAGIIALIYYVSWWVSALSVGTFPQFMYILGLLVALLYTGTQFLGPWIIYMAACWHKNEQPEPLAEMPSVDVFIPIYKESYAIVERTLRAACEMKGEHRTWLLDDDPGFDKHGNNQMQDLALKLGTEYLPHMKREGNKPGNINHALQHANGDIIVIFDVDHTPESNFLEESLPHFADPQIGFVQVMLSFRNNNDSWVARSAADASLDFYNPTSLGLDALGSATKMGTNILMRRIAIDSLGGYQYGLADDLSTSLALHANNWKSAYVAEPLAPGLIPSDLISWFTQQLKWARGVFEIQLTEYPKLFSRLTLAEKLSYGVRVTYYWAGPIIAIHLAATLFCLFFGSSSLRLAFQNYLWHLIPLGLSSILIRRYATKRWLHPKVSGSGDLIGATSLVYATWPVYLAAWIMALLRRPLPFILTPKEKSGALNLVWLLPQILTSVALIIGTIYALLSFPLQEIWMTLLWAMAQTIPMVVLIWRWYCEFKEVHRATPKVSKPPVNKPR